jgi:hypothetical protein
LPRVNFNSTTSTFVWHECNSRVHVIHHYNQLLPLATINARDLHNTTGLSTRVPMSNKLIDVQNIVMLVPNFRRLPDLCNVLWMTVVSIHY